jgi:hypothetical protein
MCSWYTPPSEKNTSLPDYLSRSTFRRVQTDVVSSSILLATSLSVILAYTLCGLRP